MTRFEIHDEVGRVFNVEAICSVDTMRAYVSEFKTHCKEENSSYVMAHFINWVKKYKGLTLVNDNETTRYRVDM